LNFIFIKILGGLLLIWIVNDLRKDLLDIKKVKPTTKKSKEPSFISSIGKSFICRYYDKF